MRELIIGLFVSVGGALILAIGGALARSLAHQGRKLDAISDVVVGTPADPIRGTKAVPSVAARLGALEEAVSSRTDTDARIVGLEAWRDEHMRTCGRATS